MFFLNGRPFFFYAGGEPFFLFLNERVFGTY